MQKIITLLLFVFAFTACNSTKYTKDNLPPKQLIFGEGGGFTGGVKEYILLENGQLFSRSNFMKVDTELPKIKKSLAKQYFAKFDELKLREAKFIQPGNMYKFIQLDLDSATNYRIVWAEGNPELPPGVASFFSELKAQIQPPKAEKK